jgi:hypothetical protein
MIASHIDVAGQSPSATPNQAVSDSAACLPRVHNAFGPAAVPTLAWGCLQESGSARFDSLCYMRSKM